MNLGGWGGGGGVAGAGGWHGTLFLEFGEPFGLRSGWAGLGWAGCGEVL